MTRVIVDSTLSAKLRVACEMLEICDEDGQVLGHYQPTARVTSPYSREELERRRKEEGGLTLEQILNRLSNP